MGSVGAGATAVLGCCSRYLQAEVGCLSNPPQYRQPAWAAVFADTEAVRSKAPLQAREGWLCRLHFYNTPITNDFMEAAHPLNIIRSICEPGDFIVIKLDIDNGPLETAIMAEIAADPGLRHCIAEMFYEQHYDHAGAEAI